ncbi:hypothetical protein HHI36_011850, partial [Cryptolaemus montrouzieri]
ECRSEKIDKILNFTMEDPIVHVQETDFALSKLLKFNIINIRNFVLSLFGYNRLKISKQLNENLEQISKMVEGKDPLANPTTCLATNLKSLTVIYHQALDNWYCLKLRMIDLHVILVGVIKSIFDGLKSTMGKTKATCSLGICLFDKGVGLAKMGTRLSKLGLRLISFVANFMFYIRKCQKDITHIIEVTDSIVQNNKFCIKSSC